MFVITGMPHELEDEKSFSTQYGPVRTSAFKLAQNGVGDSEWHDRFEARGDMRAQVEAAIAAKKPLTIVVSAWAKSGREKPWVSLVVERIIET